MEYTVKEIADLAGVSVRTLHYYDEIGLLSPSRVGSNGYRHYEAPELFRLQQILLYREMGFELKQVASILDRPDFNPLQSLIEHRCALERKIERLQVLIGTVDRTLAKLKGELDMDEKGIFNGLSSEEQEGYKQEAIELWGTEEVKPSYERWSSYSEAQQQKILDEGNAIYADLVECMPNGVESPEAQSVMARWHRNLRYFYEPSIERMRGLGEMYVNHPEFAHRLRNRHPDLPEFLCSAIRAYCDKLETHV